MAMLCSDGVLFPAPPSQIHQALRALYPEMGITADMIGTYGATDKACPEHVHRKLARKVL